MAKIKTFWIDLFILVAVAGCNGIYSPYPAPATQPSDLPEYSENSTSIANLQTPSLTPFKTRTPVATPTKETWITPTEPIYVKLDPQKWEHIQMRTNEGWPINYAFAESKDGTIWSLANISGGIRIFRFSDDEWTEFDPYKNPIFEKKRLLSLAVDQSGTVLFGTNTNEIISFDGYEWKTQFVKDENKRKSEIVSILIRKDGELCAISNEDMACKKKDSSWIVYPIDSPPNKNGWHDVNNAVLTPNDEIWILLNNGWLHHYDGHNWGGYRVADLIGPIASSSDDSIWLFYPEDRSYMLGKWNSQEKIPAVEFNQDCWYCPPHHLLEAKDGTLWIGCLINGGYQIIKFKKNGMFETVDNSVINFISHPNEKAEKYPFGLISGIFQARDGVIWFGTSSGIYKYHPEKDEADSVGSRLIPPRHD